MRVLCVKVIVTRHLLWEVCLPAGLTIWLLPHQGGHAAISACAKKIGVVNAYTPHHNRAHKDMQQVTIHATMQGRGRQESGAGSVLCWCNSRLLAFPIPAMQWARCGTCCCRLAALPTWNLLMRKPTHGLCLKNHSGLLCLHATRIRQHGIEREWSTCAAALGPSSQAVL